MQACSCRHPLLICSDQIRGYQFCQVQGALEHVYRCTHGCWLPMSDMLRFKAGQPCCGGRTHAWRLTQLLRHLVRGLACPGLLLARRGEAAGRGKIASHMSSRVIVGLLGLDRSPGLTSCNQRRAHQPMLLQTSARRAGGLLGSPSPPSGLTP